MASEERQPDKRVLRFVWFYGGRCRGDSEDQIAINSGFESPRALYQRLHEDGFPICPRCGQMFVEAAHCQSPEGKRRRKVRSGGEPVELPPAREARPLFRKALESLRKSIEPPANSLAESEDFMDAQFIDVLGSLQENLQGELFVSAFADDPLQEPPVVYRREDFSPEEWEEMCEHRPEATSADTLSEERVTVPCGAQTYPNDTLLRLIGMYILAGESLETLVEKLHPEPEKVDLREIEKHLHGYETQQRRMPGMLDKLRLIATLVRGGRLRTGPKDELSAQDIVVAQLVARRHEEGRTAQEIYDEVKDGGYTRDDLDRLMKLRPKLPNQNPSH